MFSTATKLFLVVMSFTVFFAEKAIASCGKFVVVKGDVQIDVVKTQKSEKAKVNSEICAGDTVAAGKEARAKIVMVDGNELNLSPDTKMTIEGYEYQPEQEKKKVLLNVLFGKVRANVKQKYDDQAKDSASNSFQVKTKSAVAGVRGTDFLTSYAPSTGKSEVVTFAGKVDVGQVGPGGKMINTVSVSAGEKTTAAPNQAPGRPVPVPASELKQLNSSTTTASSSSSSSSGTTTAAAKSSSTTASSSDAKSGDRAPASTSIAASMTDSNDKTGGAGEPVNAPVNAPAPPQIVTQPPPPPVITALPTPPPAPKGPATINISIIPKK